MLVKLRLVLISTMMMDLQHHHGVWKTLAVFTVVFHVYLCSHFCFFLFLFFHHESFTLVIASSPLYHNFFSCFYIFVILAFHSITTSFLVLASSLPSHFTLLQFLFLFLQLHYHRIPFHHYFFLFLQLCYHRIPLPSRNASFKNGYFHFLFSSNETIVNYWSC